eukprot:m.232367 g.232367  ORF g.232367 m.232367 type:complete len:482 (-) comp12345_c0_seq1:107-1552(-)
MPPKSKGDKDKKKKADKDKPEKVEDPSEGMSKDELASHNARLRDELEREREERNYFQLERDKINTFWEITKRQLETIKSELRNKDRELEEVEERHAVEIKVYKQKVKHLLYEHQNRTTELKTDAAVGLKVAQEEHRAEEGTLRKDKRSLKVELKEMELSHEEIIKNLQMEYDKQVSKLRDDLQRQARELQLKYDKKMATLRDELDLRRKTDIFEIEERKNFQINTLMRNHEKAFAEIKNYYNDITLNNLALINSLKEQVEDMKKREERTDKQMAEIVAENKRLAEPLARARLELDDCKKQMANHEKDKTSLATAKSRLKAQDEALTQLRWEHEVLVQRFAQVEKERDDLYDQFSASIQEVQQKTGLRNLLLEKKLAALLDQLEKKEAQLNEVLAASNLDPTALAVVTRKLEDVLDSKNQAIKDLQLELARLSKAHQDVVAACESKMRDFGIPAEQLGFKPATVTLPQTLGRAPAGLVTASN